MIKVDRHAFEGNYTDRQVDKELAFIQGNLAAQMQKAPAAIGRHISGQTTIAGGAYHLGRSQDVIALLNASCDCAGAMYAAISAAPGTTVTFPFLGAELSGPSGPPGFNAGPAPWVTALLVAVAVRRANTVATLLRVPAQELSRAPGDRDNCFVHLVYALQAFFLDEDIREPLTEFERLSHPDNLRIATPRTLERFRALAPALLAVRDKDQARFTDSLVGALEAHKKTFGRGDDKDSHAYLIDYHATGLAVLAQERGLALEVESPYMPTFLVQPTP